MRQYFVYITTNLINGKQYVGDHFTDNLNDGYLGSGNRIKNAIKKYGKKNFKREILEFFNTKEKAFNGQEKYIKEYNTLTPYGYNISPKGGYGVPASYLNEETKIKIGKSNKGKLQGRKLSDSHKQKISKNHRKHNTDETNHKISQGNKGKNKGKQPWLGKHHSEESKQKISNSTKGRVSSRIGKKASDKTKKLLSEKAKLRIGNKNSMYNKNHSDESKKKMSEKGKNRRKFVCPYCGKEITLSMYNRWHGENCKFKKI